MWHKVYVVLVVWFHGFLLWGQYSMPMEELPHEGTWLQWPHNYTYGAGAEDVESSWVEMTSALSAGERVHIVAYNDFEVLHISALLEEANVDMAQVDFLVCPTDDFWVRDNGPMFVEDAQGEWAILNWGFNGWGGDAPFSLDDDVPLIAGNALGLPVVDLSAVVLEGGAIEMDGQGTLLATRSSITGEDRNPGFTEEEIEAFFSTYLGAEQIVWLDGQFGGVEDITDQHIDGFVKFTGDNTMVTMSNPDLAYWYVSASDRDILDGAENAQGIPFTRVNLPLTQDPVHTTWGENLGFRGTYVNYYIGNVAVLVPEYGDPMDQVALDIIQGLYPARTAVGINCQNMSQWGGMVHCVTQQQPLGATSPVLEAPEAIPEGEIVRVWDSMGRETTSQSNALLLYLFSNGEVRKAFHSE